MKKLDYIDALRGLAILGVLMVHVYLYGNSISNLPFILSIVFGEGARGVQLFFLASAFTLFLSYKNRSTSETYPIRNYVIRRFFRIAPMYYIGICYFLFQEGFGPRYWLGDETHITVFNIMANTTFLHAFNPHWMSSIVPGGWSIGVEMTFYALLPFLCWKIKNINHALNFFMISLLINAIFHLILANHSLISSSRLWNEYMFFYFPNQLPIFALGILMYFSIYESQSGNQLSGKSLLVLFGMILTQLATGTDIFFSKHILFGIGFLILGYALSLYQPKIIVNQVIKYIGKISFSMYFVHFAVLYWLTKLHFIDYSVHGIRNYCIRYAIVLVITITISTVFYHLVEVPFQKLGKKLIEILERKAKLNDDLTTG